MERWPFSLRAGTCCEEASTEFDGHCVAWEKHWGGCEVGGPLTNKKNKEIKQIHKKTWALTQGCLRQSRMWLLLIWVSTKSAGKFYTGNTRQGVFHNMADNEQWLYPQVSSEVTRPPLKGSLKWGQSLEKTRSVAASLSRWDDHPTSLRWLGKRPTGFDKKDN